MLPKDKELMHMHLQAIAKEINNLPDDKEDRFTWIVNCNLIDIRDKIRDYIKGPQFTPELNATMTYLDKDIITNK